MQLEVINAKTKKNTQSALVANVKLWRHL